MIVLDDLHRVTEPAIHDALDYLVEHLPPAMHLVVTTRVDPRLSLARLRTRGQLAEFRLAHLRFAAEEIARYLNQQWDLALSAGDLAALRKQTEGWVASLHLLAARLHDIAPGDQRSRYIDRFTQSDRLIFDLLAEEILDQQPPELRQFLLQTSILAELTPQLCATVTQNPRAPQLLEQAYRRNLFLVAIEEASSDEIAYRYHALFANFLQRRLVQEYPDLVLEYHRRAAEAQITPEQAVQQHRSIRHTALLNDPRLTLALLYHRWQRPDAALAELKTALVDLRRRCMPGVILQEGKHILPLLEMAAERGMETEMIVPLIATLRQSAAPRPVPVLDSGETLSAREMEVLRLLATGAGNRAIAEQLVITERTVKAHVTSILAKLDVSSRTQAVARAREIRII